MWIRGKKGEISTQDDEGNLHFITATTDKVFNSKITEIFHGSYLDQIFAHTKTQTKHTVFGYKYSQVVVDKR